MHDSRLRSRKFWLSLMGALMGVSAPLLSGEVSPEKGLEMAIAILVSYVLGQGYVDAQKAKMAAAPEVAEAPEEAPVADDS